jgi:hypothetical protein
MPPASQIIYKKKEKMLKNKFSEILLTESLIAYCNLLCSKAYVYDSVSLRNEVYIDIRFVFPYSSKRNTDVLNLEQCFSNATRFFLAVNISIYINYNEMSAKKSSQLKAVLKQIFAYSCVNA